ncbi:MAG: ribosome maturation factor RimM [Elusimicrobia bacterium]|nr:ribosome maturation factor RimM [Elusimicrobiota bacterium]MBU2614019.1 ribosome maturation factor RimM [Elusimicrobiota bacterium]
MKIGYVVKPHGIKGLLSVSLAKKYSLDCSQKIFLEKLSNFCGPYEITCIEQNKNFLLLTIKEINDIEQAEKFSGYSIGIPVKNLPKDIFWVEDLVGCTVLSEKNEELGIIESIMTSGPNDIYVVKTRNNKEFLVPAIKQIVKKVDIPGKKVIIDLIPGLIE